MHRRKFLKIAGSASVIVAATAGTGFFLTRSPTDALKPWKNAGSIYSDPIRWALSYAILAPNPHNRQPWLVDLISDTDAVLYCDPDRLLPVTDPFSRQIVIGLGCFLELFSIAASNQGYQAGIRYFPEGEPGEKLDRRPIAYLSLKQQPDLKADPLFTQCLNRQTNRSPFDTSRQVSDTTLQGLSEVSVGDVRVAVTNSEKLRDELRVLTRDAMVTEFRTADAYQESVDLMRIGRAEIERNPDGIFLSGAFLESLRLAGILTRENLADPNSKAFQTGLSMVEENTMSAMGFIWINTLGNERISQIEVGRAYMRIALQASAEKLAIQPMSQALQEYSAVEPYYKTIHASLAQQPGERVQMLARIGYAANTGPTPRWPLEARIMES
ncbi:MAG: hypothetical protein L3J24_02755 [Xanthomonadales bacterium]|nr:hypothetical protein [Xanthomonadales bacterium]